MEKVSDTTFYGHFQRTMAIKMQVHQCRDHTYRARDAIAPHFATISLQSKLQRYPASTGPAFIQQRRKVFQKFEQRHSRDMGEAGEGSIKK